MTHQSLPRAISLALALAAASLGPLVLSGTALAAGSSTAAAKSDAADAGKNAKPTPKAKAKSGKKGVAGKAHAKPEKARAKPGKAKAGKTKRAARENKSPKRGKQAPKAGGPGSDDRPRAGKASPETLCDAATVSFDRGGVEADRFALVDCKGKPRDSAIAKVSVLARPWGAPKRSGTIARVDAGVIKRLEAIAKKFPGRTITLVGGPPPSGGGASAHQAGRAVDVRVDGVDNRKLAEACRSLPDTSCGYYPNAAFVHVDVRAPGAGKSFWIDASEPGEPPRYVSSWP